MLSVLIAVALLGAGTAEVEASKVLAEPPDSAPGPPGPPHAAPPPPPPQRSETPPRTVVSLPLPALLHAAFAVQGERFSKSGKLSAACSLGARAAAGQDFRSLTLATGAELRWWFFRPPDYAKACGAGGPYAATRLELGWTRLTPAADPAADPALASSGFAFAHTLTAGYRFPIRCTVEVTPSVGIALVTVGDFGGRFAAVPKGDLVAGLTVGWML